MVQTWLEPWFELSLADRAAFEAELCKEIGVGHLLEGIRTLAVGKSASNDDVLFQLFEVEHEYAVVHLTWTGKREGYKDWPFTQLYKTWYDFLVQRMAGDNVGY
jgi:hypothetical protein